MKIIKMVNVADRIYLAQAGKSQFAHKEIVDPGPITYGALGCNRGRSGKAFG